MNPDELSKRGERFFSKLLPEDRVALKWFLTGQIQNILANEHGIGGSKGVQSNVRAAANARIDNILKNIEFQEMLANRLASQIRLDYPKMVLAAAEKMTADAIKKAAGDAASRVKIHVFIEQDPDEPEETRSFGAF